MPGQVVLMELAGSAGQPRGWRKKALRRVYIDEQERDVFVASRVLGGGAAVLRAARDGAPTIAPKDVEEIYISLNWDVREFGDKDRRSFFHSTREKFLAEYDKLSSGGT